LRSGFLIEHKRVKMVNYAWYLYKVLTITNSHYQKNIADVAAAWTVKCFSVLSLSLSSMRYWFKYWTASIRFIILHHSNNVLLNGLPIPLTTNVAWKFLQIRHWTFGSRVSDAVFLARGGGEEVRCVVGERRLRQIGSWQLRFAMETRRLLRLPQPDP